MADLLSELLFGHFITLFHKKFPGCLKIAMSLPRAVLWAGCGCPAATYEQSPRRTPEFFGYELQGDCLIPY